MVGEFEDYALLRAFGQRGTGLFPAHSVLAKEICKQYGFDRVGQARNVLGYFYAITVECRVNHPAVQAICESAKKQFEV